MMMRVATYSLLLYFTIISKSYASELLPSIVVSDNLSSTEFDSIVVIAPDIESVPLESLRNPLETYLSIDEFAEKGVFVVPCDLPAKKIIFSGTGNLENDWDDVR